MVKDLSSAVDSKAQSQSLTCMPGSSGTLSTSGKELVASIELKVLLAVESGVDAVGRTSPAGLSVRPYDGCHKQQA